MHPELESTLFEPLVILPAQVAVDAQWVNQTSGPVALMLAVLEDASRCIARGHRRRHGISPVAAEAEAWVSSDSREWPFAFASICDVLGLDLDATRRRLLADGPTHKRPAVWRIMRGQGRTSVCAPRASRAA